MQKNLKQLTVFEHQKLRLGDTVNGIEFDLETLTALQKYYGESGVPYYTLIHNGVCFNEYVGVIQVRNFLIEVLPKADNVRLQAEGHLENVAWRDILIKMLFSVGMFDIHAPSSSSLKLRQNSILDLYFELFIKEVEYLLHIGLVKKYRKKDGNLNALKGRINFAKQIQHNLIHAEMFYMNHSTYDVEHHIHLILYKAIRVLRQINMYSQLHSRIGNLMLYFPEMPDIKISPAIFDRIVLDRKTKHYEGAIKIARLILLRLSPDISRGSDEVLALMFDMNKLWEKFIYVSLRKNREEGLIVKEQSPKKFWRAQGGSASTMRPDIVVKMDNRCVVLDTKWKSLKGSNPSPEDLRQMFVYHQYFEAERVALVYPGNTGSVNKGKYLDPFTAEDTNKECSIVVIDVNANILEWQKDIYIKLSNMWSYAHTV